MALDLAPEGSLHRIEARRELMHTARQAERHGREYWQWVIDEAPQWALDAVSQREVDAIVAWVWGME